MKIKKAVILAGGLGTRMAPITNFIAKEMLPIFDKPVLEYLIDDLKKEGIREILIVSHKSKNIIQNYFLNSDIIISYIFPNQPNGVVDALKHAKNFVNGDDFVLLYGDVLFDGQKSSISQMLQMYKKTKKSVVATRQVDWNRVGLYGCLDVRKNKDQFYIYNIVEKPDIKKAPSNVVLAGQFVLTSSIFKILDELKPEKLFTDALIVLAKRKELFMKEIEGEFFDIGNKVGYALANLNFSLKDENFKKEMEKYVKRF